MLLYRTLSLLMDFASTVKSMNPGTVGDTVTTNDPFFFVVARATVTDGPAFGVMTTTIGLAMRVGSLPENVSGVPASTSRADAFKMTPGAFEAPEGGGLTSPAAMKMLAKATTSRVSLVMLASVAEKNLRRRSFPAYVGGYWVLTATRSGPGPKVTCTSAA